MNRHDVPGAMRAVKLTRLCGKDSSLDVDDIEVPSLKPQDVLIRVRAVGINNAELLSVVGVSPAPVDGVLGLEAVGDIVGGDPALLDEYGFSIGQRVGALLRSGAYAEYVNAPVGCLLPLPASLTDVEAATLPESLAASWWNLCTRGRVQDGDRVLIRGGAGGVGVIAVQVASALGAQVTTTARSMHTEKFRALGVSEVVDYTERDAEDRLSALSEKGFDVILDSLGGPAIGANVQLLGPGGRLVILGMQEGPTGEIDVPTLMNKGCEISSSSLGKLSDAQRERLCSEVREELVPLLESRTITPVAPVVVPWPDVTVAHDRFREHGKFGKVVVAR